MNRPLMLWLCSILLVGSPGLFAQDISSATVIAHGTTIARSEAARWADVINAKDFGAIGDGLKDDTSAINAAINAAFAAGSDLFIPSGTYQVTGLWLPGRVIVNGQDDRGKTIRIYGQGSGEPFAQSTTASGTVIRSQTNAPVLQDCIGYDGDYNRVSSNGTVEIDHIRFEGKSETPVILLNSFYGLSNIHHIVISQDGAGDGLKMTNGATVSVNNCYAFNSKYSGTPKYYSSRTGVGFNFPTVKDGGLVTFSKCTSRGWLTGFVIGGVPGIYPYVARIENSECSTVYNGIINYGRKTIIDGNYFEGAEGGIGIQDLGDYTTISNNLLFAGFSRGIDASNALYKGTLIQGNVIGLAGQPNVIGIDIGSSPYRNIVFNTVENYTGNNTTAIRVVGNQAGVVRIGNIPAP